MDKCTNCGNEFTGKYCNNCGQGKIKRLEVKTILHDVTHGILHWENSILKTFRNLLLNPGRTVKDYISGRRKSFIKPFSYFIFIQTIFAVVFHRMSEQYFAFMNVKVTSDSAEELNRISEIQHIVGQYVNYFNYFMPVILAFFFYLFFRKKTGVNYAESLAAAFFWVGTTLVFSVVLMLLSLIDVRIWNARFFIGTVYYIYAIIKFSDVSIVKGIFKGLAVTSLSYIIYILFVSVLVISYLYFAEGINVFNAFSPPK
jgi:hypothetical protein